MENQRTLNMKDFAVNVLLHWRSILGVALIGAVLAGGYAKVVRTNRPETVSASSAEQEAESALELFEISKEELLERNLSDTMQNVEKENEYTKKSLLMQIDPYQVDYAYITIAKSGKENSAGRSDLSWVSGCMTALLSDEVMTEIAEAYDTEAKYVREIIRYHVPEDGWIDVLSHDATRSDTDNVDVQIIDAPGDSKAYAIEILGATKEQAEFISDRVFLFVDTYIKENAIDDVAVNQVPVMEKVDRTLMDQQNDIRERVLTYSDTISRVNKAIDSQSAELVEEQGLSVKKSVAVGFIGGAFVMLLLWCLLFFLNDSVKSQSDITDHFHLTCVGDFSKKSKRLFGNHIDTFIRKWNHSDGRRSENAELEMTAANIRTYCRGEEVIGVTGYTKAEILEDKIQSINQVLERQGAVQRLVYVGNIVDDSQAKMSLLKNDKYVLAVTLQKDSFYEINNTIDILRANECEILGAFLM